MDSKKISRRGMLQGTAATGAGLYAYRPDPGTTAHPLALISPATSRTVSSTFAQLVPAPARLAIHPHDAAARSIRDGDTVRETGKRFGANRTWKRVSGQWVLQGVPDGKGEKP